MTRMIGAPKYANDLLLLSVLLLLFNGLMRADDKAKNRVLATVLGLAEFIEEHEHTTP